MAFQNKYPNSTEMKVREHYPTRFCFIIVKVENFRPNITCPWKIIIKVNKYSSGLVLYKQIQEKKKKKKKTKKKQDSNATHRTKGNTNKFMK